MKSNYDLLIAKINEFIRKFYLNKLLRGSIYSAASILALYPFLFVLVYYTHPGTGTKTTLFFSFLFISGLTLAFWVVKPAMAYLRLGKTLSIEQAANLIGNHFFNVKDRLLNTLQLKALMDEAPQHNQLILAGIDQKIIDLKPVPFAAAIDLGDNKKYIKYLIMPLAVILSIGIIAPAMLREGTDSLIRYNERSCPKPLLTSKS